MSRREKARHLLQMARDRLAEKLTDLVLDNPDFIEQEGYLPVDDEIAELGDRLWRLNQVINNFPPETVNTENVHSTITAQPTHSGRMIDLTQFVVQQGQLLPTWNDFLAAIESEHRNEAAKILSTLARIDAPLAFQATNVFAAQYALYTDEFRAKAKSLRAQLCAGAAGSVQLIHELFGITGEKATHMYQSLRTTV